MGTRVIGNGYIKSWEIPAVDRFEWVLIPTSVADTESYICDGYYATDTGTVTYIGGARTAWELHGAFFLYTDFTESSASSHIGCRLMKLP